MFNNSQMLGVALTESGPTVSFPTPAGATARVTATVAGAPLLSVLGLFVGQPTAFLRAAKYVDAEAGRRTCVVSLYEGHPELEKEIARIIERDFSTKMVFDDFLSYSSAHTSLKVASVQEGTSIGDLTHEAALRQAKTMGVDVLFELSHIDIDFDVDYGGTTCAIRPLVRLKYRIVLVGSDKEIGAGYAHERVSSEEEAGSKTVAHWLDEPGSLAELIEKGYREAMPQIWYVGLPGPE